MKRDIYTQLLNWKSSSRRKPLLLQGARQTGKTFILKEFGYNEYRNTAYCNFEEDPALGEFFKRDLNPDRIVSELSIFLNCHIEPGKDLLIFDEIQAENTLPFKGDSANTPDGVLGGQLPTLEFDHFQW